MVEHVGAVVTTTTDLDGNAKQTLCIEKSSLHASLSVHHTAVYLSLEVEFQSQFVLVRILPLRQCTCGIPGVKQAKR